MPVKFFDSIRNFFNKSSRVSPAPPPTLTPKDPLKKPAYEREDTPFSSRSNSDNSFSDPDSENTPNTPRKPR